MITIIYKISVLLKISCITLEMTDYKEYRSIIDFYFLKKTIYKINKINNFFSQHIMIKNLSFEKDFKKYNLFKDVRNLFRPKKEMAP